MNEKMDKKQLRLTIIAVVTLIALVAGATYAYFSVGTTNSFGTSTINATADSVGNVILQGNNANLTLNVTAVDMARENNIVYYASIEGKKTIRTEEAADIMCRPFFILLKLNIQCTIHHYIRITSHKKQVFDSKWIKIFYRRTNKNVTFKIFFISKYQ